MVRRLKNNRTKLGFLGLFPKFIRTKNRTDAVTRAYEKPAGEQVLSVTTASVSG